MKHFPLHGLQDLVQAMFSKPVDVDIFFPLQVILLIRTFITKPKFEHDIIRV